MDCIPSDSELELVEVLVAGELRFDSVIGSVAIVAVCELLIVAVVVVGAGGVHACFGCSAGPVKGL